MTKKITEEQIRMQESDDSDMPEPSTYQYNDRANASNEQKNVNLDSLNKAKMYVNVTNKFIKLFYECMGKMPYSSVITAGDNKISLVKLFNYIEKHNSMKYSIMELELIIGYIRVCPYEHVAPLMEIIEDKTRQAEIWSPAN